MHNKELEPASQDAESLHRNKNSGSMFQINSENYYKLNSPFIQ